VDTSADSFTFLPPESIRGDIARAIFYMDLRYSDQNNDGLDLHVTDCPTGKPNEMAYRSQLLTWHLADPVSQAERQRNQRACSRWQGNRNVFVDFPEWIEKLFGQPQTISGEGLGYPGCELIVDSGSTPSTSPSPSSSVSSTPNGKSCDSLTAGDVMMVGINSDNPEGVALVALEDLGGGLELLLADNAWTGTGFRTNEGSISFTVPTQGIVAGTVFGYGAFEDLLYRGDWESSGGQFQLSTSGDTVILYCFASGTILFLSAFDFSGDGWMQANLNVDSYGTSNSALPEALASTGAVSVLHFDSYKYTGPAVGSRPDIIASLSDPAQWDGSNKVSNSVSFPLFTITTSPDSSQSDSTTAGFLAAGDIMIVAINSQNPDFVALVALKNIPGDSQIYLTDNAWTGASFRTNEGTLMLTAPSSGISSGVIFGYGPGLLHGESWESAGGRFALAESGDTVMVYTEKDDVVQHLGGLSYNGGGWQEPGQDEDSYETGSSALPSVLIPVGAISLPHMDNYVYAGPTEGSRSFLQSSLMNASNWEGLDINPVNPPSGRFTVTSGAASSWHGCLSGFANAFGFLLSFL
jgi:hypothetical protein